MNGIWKNVSEPTDRQDEIDTSAAHWVTRLGAGPMDPASRRVFERWLAEDPKHAAAFAEAQAAWAAMDAVALNPGALQRDVARPIHQPVRWHRAAALAASLLILVGCAFLWAGDPLVMVAADHRTAPGERRTVGLPDGSTVELGPASAIAVRYTDSERRVELLSGLAYFTAAPRRDPELRPFVVEAASGTARALGTQFAVEHLSDAVEVTVVEHEVSVAAPERNGMTARVVVAPGRSVRYADAGLALVREAKIDRALAWRRDRLFFDRVALDHVVNELNRYRRGRIIIANASLASRRVSGVFDIADPDAVLGTIARELGARRVSTPLITLLY